MEIGITPSNPEALEDDWVIVGQALTAHSDLDLVERAKRTGPMSYLLKPFRDEELRTTIEIALYKHQLEERLRESEEKLRIIADSLPVLISYVDSEQRYQFNNKTYELWHQHKAKEIRGKRVRDVLGDQRYGKIVNHIELALSGETVRFEAALGCGDGRTRDIEATYVPHFGDKGEVKGFVGLVADITNRKAVEAALQRAKDELEAKVKERTAELAKRNEQLRWEVRQKESAEQEALMQTTLLNAVNRLLKEALESENERELARVCLSVAKEITRSEFAFIGELNKDGRLDTVALSDPGWKPRRMSKAKADKQLRNLPICGIWAPALSMERTQTINAPVLHPDSVGVPDGHPTITCFLGVPLKRAGKTFGLIGLGNKEGGYTSVDSQGVEALSIAFVEALERIRGKRLISEMHDLNERILSSSPVGIATFRSDGQCTMVNQAMASMIGATRAQVASQNFRDIESWKRSGLLEDAEEVLATGAARRREVHVISTFGQEVYLDCHFSRFTSGDDHHVLLTVNDISRLKQVEEELRVSEARFREIAELLPQFVYEIDGNGFLTFANTAGLEATGYTLEDLAKGLSLGDVIAPEDLDRALVDMERTMLGERIIGHEYALKRKDGTTLPIITYSDPVVREEKVVGFRGVAVDISERKEAERALRDSEERFRRLIESSPMGISIFQHGKRVYVNPAEVRMFGYDTAEEVLQLRAEDLYVPESRDLIVGLLAAVPDQETWLSGHEAMGVKKDGTVIDLVLWLSKAAFRGDPAVLSFVADISQEKSLREQLFRAQKMESLGTLAGGIAHDFNNLLTVVRGYSELLLASKKEEDQDYEDLRKIASAAQKGADLVRRILTFSRKIETHVRPIDLNDQIVQLRKILERTIPKMIEIRLHLGENLKRINADAGQIEQLLMNLAVNAQHAMPEGGQLIIETQNVHLDEEYCKSRVECKPGEYVLLSVSDTGHGMEKAVLDRMFEPFFTTKEAGKGSGLGLPMVYGIVKGHGGAISCYSEPGAGTSFHVYFPATEKEEYSDQSQVEETPAGGSETILLVDDEEDVRELASRILSKAGYKVLTASTGKEALNVYQERKADISLVVLDLIMPVMGGDQCLEELLKTNPDVKVLVASGLPANGPAKGQIEAQAKGFVKKPYKRTELLRMVRKALESDK